MYDNCRSLNFLNSVLPFSFACSLHWCVCKGKFFTHIEDANYRSQRDLAALTKSLWMMCRWHIETQVGSKNR